MRAMRRFAVSVMFSHGLTRPATRRLAARRLKERGPVARGPALAALRVAALGGMITLIAGTPAVLAAGTGPALATVANAPRTTLASVIPSTAIPRSRVTFAVYCANPAATSATLHGRPLGLTKHIPMRPNTAAGDFTASVSLPGGITPGTYHPRIECSDGTSATARLLVPAFAAAGGMSVSAWLRVGGLILIGMVAVGIALRSRKRGQSGDPDDSAPLDRGEKDYTDHPDQPSLRF
jgi:hypothetical protein